MYIFICLHDKFYCNSKVLLNKYLTIHISHFYQIMYNFKTICAINHYYTLLISMMIEDENIIKQRNSESRKKFG